MGTIPERDWKFLRSIQEELLATLCGRINRKSAEILRDARRSETEKYRELYQHVRDSDRIVADCFDDWRRSNLWLKLGQLCKHELLTPDHLTRLSEDTISLLRSAGWVEHTGSEDRRAEGSDDAGKTPGQPGE